MGHGYFTILGWGVVISTEIFAQAFPAAVTRHVERIEVPSYQASSRQIPGPSFRYTTVPNPTREKIYWEFYSDVMGQLENEHQVSFHYEQQQEPTEIFICSKNHYSLDARAGEQQNVDLDFLFRRVTQIERFIEDHFSGIGSRLMLYSYQGG